MESDAERGTLSGLSRFSSELDSDSEDDASKTLHKELQKAIDEENFVEQMRMSERIHRAVETQDDTAAKTLLLRSAAKAQLALLKFIVEWHADDCLKIKDFWNNNMLHLVASCENTDAAAKALELIIKKVKREQIYEKNSSGETLLHIAARNRKNPTVLLWLISNVSDKRQFFVPNDVGDTAVHCAFYCQDLGTLKLLTQTLDLQQCLDSKGAKNQTASHKAALNTKNPAVLLWLISDTGDKQQFFVPDADGNTTVHLAFENQNLDTLKNLIKFLGLSACMDVSGKAQRTILQCSAGNTYYPDVLSWLIEHVEVHCPEKANQVIALDANGNTLLHALFRNSYNLFSVEQGNCVSQLISCFACLIQARVDPKAENKFQMNCLFASEMHVKFLCSLLTALNGSDLKETFQKLQRNSEGLHAAHILCQRYELKVVEQPLSNLCGISSEELLSVQVLEGPLKGATCLHFACEAGHRENIKYLLMKGRRLDDETAAGLTCVDFACNKGKLEVLLEIAELKGLRDLLKLVDSTNRALKLPDSQTSRSHLTRFNDSSLMASIEDGRTGRRRLGREGREVNNDMSNPDESAKVKMLFRALELDSSEMLRSLISLGFDIDEVAARFSKHLSNIILPDLKLIRQVLSLQESRSQSITLMEWAVLLEKPKLLSDLMLLPKFDIIPQTLRLLICLKPKVQLQKSEQLQKVQVEALHVVLNALDHLFVNAGEGERQILIDYLTGSIRSQFNQEAAGPLFLAPHVFLTQLDKFPECRDKSSNRSSERSSCAPRKPLYEREWQREAREAKFVSVMNLVETLDCDELFGTDCISQLVDRQWKKPPPLPWSREVQCLTCSRTANVTIEQRFIIHASFFQIFLLYFAWYVTDFSETRKSPAYDIILLAYALSFTLLEVNDFINNISPKDVYFRNSHWRTPRYFTGFFNYFDIFGLLLMWAGLVLKLLGRIWKADLLRSCQVVLSLSFLLLGFRSVSLLSYFKVVGPKISMLKSLLLKDLVPFMLIWLVLVYSFGIFFFNLLFPDFSDAKDAQALAKVFTLPVYLAFGVFESALFVTCNSSTRPTGQTCASEGGNNAYNGILMFVYLMLVNIVMLNLLIALFSRTVTLMASRAEVLWRKNLFELLQEFAEVSPVPPPLSFAHYALKLFQRCSASKCNSCTASVQSSDFCEDAQPWWRELRDFSGYPADYRRFLIFQAKQLRQQRPRLQRDIERNAGDADLKDLREAVLTAQKKDDEKMKRLEIDIKDVKGSVVTLDEHVQSLNEQVGRLNELLLRQRKRAKVVEKKM